MSLPSYILEKQTKVIQLAQIDINIDINNINSMLECNKRLGCNKRLECNKRHKAIDEQLIYNISAITQPHEIFNGWIFECKKCGQKTSNSIILDSKYELYICRVCISRSSISSKIKLLHNSTKYCRNIAKSHIDIV